MTDDGKKQEGTFLLDGLLEGKTGSDRATADRLRECVELQASTGLSFSLELDGASFSLLPSREPVRAAALGARPAGRVERAIEEVLAALPTEVRGDVYSTLHSVEIRPGEEVQTVYAIAPDGSVRSQERVIAADTEAPLRAPTSRGLAMRGLAALGVAAVFFAISSIFVDWGEQFRSLWHQVAPLKTSELKVDASAFKAWFEVTGTEIGDDSRTLKLGVKRTDAFPRALDGAPARGNTWGESLALDSLARGWIRAEVFDEKGKFIAMASVRVSALRDAETATLELPVPRDPRPARVVLGP